MNAYRTAPRLAFTDFSRCKTVVGAGLTALILAFAEPSGAATLLNGSFETPGGGSIRAVVANGAALGAWTNQNGLQVYESGGGPDLIPASDGIYYVSFGHLGESGGSLTQSFMTDLGARYNLDYDIRLQQGLDAGSGFKVSLSTGDFVLSGDATADDWTSGATLGFTGTGSTVTLTFLDVTVGGFGSNLALDNVRLTSAATGGGVPEPNVWAMMIVGFTGAGAFLRRRRSDLAAKRG